ncbi:MAG TPA: alkaline phosphatase D family protein, partial [Methylococcales bacterium]
MGKTQIAWLQKKLKNSYATWKVIAADVCLSVLMSLMALTLRADRAGKPSPTATTALPQDASW